MQKITLGWQSDEVLLEMLIAAATKKGECEALKEMISKLGQRFPAQTRSIFGSVIKNAEIIEQVIQTNLLDSCRAEIFQRMKRGQITA